MGINPIYSPFTHELAGLAPGSGSDGHDQVNVTSAVSIDGTLDIKLLNGFAPGYGDTFEMLTYGSRSGVFDQINGHILSPVLALGQFYDDTTGTLTLLATAPGDANGDQIVDAFDFGLLAGNFNLPGIWQTGDFDGNGVTDAFDFGLLAANFNGDFTSIAAAAEALGILTTPEPVSAVVLVTMAMLGMVHHGRRNRRVVCSESPSGETLTST